MRATVLAIAQHFDLRSFINCQNQLDIAGCIGVETSFSNEVIFLLILWLNGSAVVVIVKVMKVGSIFSLILFGLISCEDHHEIKCSVISAKSGYSNASSLAYYYQYLYTFDDGKLSSVENRDINTGEKISTTEFEYDAKGRITLETTINSGGYTNRHYKYEPKILTTKTYSVIGSDTCCLVEEQHFYVEHPLDKVYHHPANETALKFQNGNLIEYGSYEVSGTDTTDTFYERYYYDNHINYYNFSEYRFAIPSDFIWAKVVSENNLVRAQYITSGYDFSYLYTYDENDKLIDHKGKSGITIAFEYECN
ncbi:MAG TPA: hypothetical protein VF141_16645 [Chryseolinea sp.]